MSATAPDWVQLQHGIRLRIGELAGVFREGITANTAVAVPASDSEPLELSSSSGLTQEETAKNWLAAMGAACIVQLLAEAQSVWEHPNLWRFLYTMSKDEIAPRLEELLHVSFRITQKDLGLIERWDDDRGGLPGVGLDLERSAVSIARAPDIARAKKRAVDEIIHKLLGVDRELAFGVPSKPKFGVPAAQINTTPAPEARPGSPSVPSVGKPTRETVGRDRVRKILQAEEEIKILRPLIKSAEDYERVKGEHPDYITIKAAEKNPELKELLIGINSHHQRKAQRFAKQVAADACDVKLSTIETAWDRYKPPERRNPRKGNRNNTRPSRSRAARKSRGKE